MSRRICFLFIVLFFLWPGAGEYSYAVPAAPEAFDIIQPDGTVITARARGDEWNNWVETRQGYSIDKRNDGYWYYISRFDKDVPVLSTTRADRLPPPALQKRVRPLRQFMRPRGDRQIPRSQGVSSQEAVTSGAPSAVGASSPVSAFDGNILFILVQFTNRTGTSSESSFGSFITNNIRDYFSNASYGNVELSPADESFGTDNNGVVGWLDIGYVHPNTGGSTGNANRQLTKDAIFAADPYVNFAAYDVNNDNYVDADELAVVVIAAGFERAYSNDTPSVWGHKWSLGWGDPPGLPYIASPVVDGVRVGDYHNGAGGYAQFGERHGTHQATMGIMVHELGHLIFGLPDLYDTDGSSEGIGVFGVMGSGSWGWSYSDLNAGETPVLPCAWTKYDRGWIAPSEGSGATSIVAAGSAAATGMNAAYRISTGLPNEYFLVENRQPVGYDRGFETWFGTNYGGLAIWHIDENTISNKIGTNTVNISECYPEGPSCAADHYGVALEQADENWHLEKGNNRGNATDLWYLGNQSSFNNGSVPDSKLYNGNPSDVSITDISASGETMTAFILPDTTAPGAGTVTPFDTQYNNYVDSPFDVTAVFTDNESDIMGCEYCVSIDGTCDSEWTVGNLSGANPTWTCLQTGITGSNGQLLTLNMRATSAGGVGEGTEVIRTVDSQPPADGAFIAAPGDGRIDLSWSGFSDSGSGLDGTDTYKLVFDTAGSPDTGCTNGTEITAVTTETNYLHAELTNGTTYYYRICAIDAVGNVSAGATVSGTPAPDQYQLITSVSPPMHGSIDPDCSAGCSYDNGTIITLTAIEDSGYFFDSWENCDSPVNKVCTETMDADKSVTAHFQTCLPPVRIAGSPPVYFATLQEAYDGALDGAIIQSRDVVFIDDLLADRAIAVTIDGGYNCDYSSVTGNTALSGTMTISQETVTIGNFVFGN